MNTFIKRSISTVVFDLDGVLIDSFEAMNTAFARAYREVVGDGEPPFAEYLRYQGRWLPDILREMNLPLEMERPFVQASTNLVDRVEVYPGVTDLLRQLQVNGVRTAVATGKSVSRARHVMEAKGLLPLLDTVVGSDEVPHPKPEPDLVLEALRRIGASADGAVMVGDAAVDLQSGRTAGTATAAALWGQGKSVELLPEQPDFVLLAPSDLLKAVSATAAEDVPNEV